jgi:hypothetical protein
MTAAVNSSKSADYLRGLGFFLAETPSTDAPKHLFRPLFLATPFSPASGPATGPFNGLHPKSNFLAIPQ